jgi:hypothetical protein
VAFYEDFLGGEGGQVHPNHHLVVRAKAKLVLAYSSPATRQHMERKVELAQAVLSVLEVILPGILHIVQYCTMSRN